MSKNYEYFLKANLNQYAGKWVAIVNQRVVSSGNDAQVVYKEAKKKFPKEKPSLAKIPSGETLILILVKRCQ